MLGQTQKEATVLGFQTPEDGESERLPLSPNSMGSRNDNRPKSPFSRAISPISVNTVKSIPLARCRLFNDPDGIKSEVRQSMLTHPYDVKEFYREHGCWQCIARSAWFENCTLVVVVINALWIWVDTDYNKASILSEAPLIFQIAEHTFGAYFLMEWVVRFMAFQRKRYALKDCWFIFDSVLVFMTILDTWIMQMLIVANGGGAQAFDSSVLRVARLLRLVRIARMARLMRIVPELMVIVKGIATATRSVLFTLLLVLTVTYFFAIALTQLTAGTQSGETYFKHVPYAMITITMHCTLLDNIGKLMLMVMEDSPIAAIFVMLCVFLSALTFMNLLIGVLCEVVTRVSRVEQEASAITFVKGKLQKIVEEFDTNGDNMISKTEFEKLITHADALKALRELGVDPASLVDIAAIIFETEAQDDNDYEAALSFPDFMELVLEMRGQNTVTVRDIVLLKKFVRELDEDTNKQIQELRIQIDTFCTSMKTPSDKRRSTTAAVSGSREQSPLPAPRRISVLKPITKLRSSDSSGSLGSGRVPSDSKQEASLGSPGRADALRQSAGFHSQHCSRPRGRSPEGEQERSPCWQLKRPPPIETTQLTKTDVKADHQVRDQLACLEADMAAGLEQLHTLLREARSQYDLERSVMHCFPGKVDRSSGVTNPAFVELAVAGSGSKGEASSNCSFDAAPLGEEEKGCVETSKLEVALANLATSLGGFDKATQENLHKMRSSLHGCLHDALAGS